jgi:exoribonuclease R
MLSGREGERFDAVVTSIDDRGATIQLCALPITARIDAAGLTPGDTAVLTLTEADPAQRRIGFTQSV